MSCEHRVNGTCWKCAGRPKRPPAPKGPPPLLKVERPKPWPGPPTKADLQDMKCVQLESPFAGKDAIEKVRNERYLAACLRDSIMLGESPFASHGLYTLVGVLDDTDPEERKKGIEAGLEIAKRMDRTVVYVDFGVSEGMEIGIEHARKHGRLVEYRLVRDLQRMDWLVGLRP